MPLSSFHPVVQRWFAATFGAPTLPQRLGWPRLRAGEHALIAAPTGTGKTLAAFLASLDALLARGALLDDATRVLYVSPLRALSNDVQKNLARPLAELRALDPTLPEVRVLVRTGDTPQRERALMSKRPPHVLVTTPESLYVLLGSARGRATLATVETVIVDEIHALASDKRGAHLALSLERLEALAQRPVQRIGLSATVRPLEDVARLLVGEGRECAIVDATAPRALDLDVLLPDAPLGHVCTHEQWAQLYQRMAELVRAHRTTIAFVNTRKEAERLSARLSEIVGRERVACHHGSLSRELRLDAEERLKRGDLAVLVATASLELGIDVGEIDLVFQVGSVRRIATLLQRAGRAGHGVDRTPKARLLPLTLFEAQEHLAALAAIRRGTLDATPMPRAALDVLAQQIVAACAQETWDEDALFALVRRALPYRDLARDDFERVVELVAHGRGALLHRDSVHRTLRGTRRASRIALTSGGAIPDRADYRVVVEPEGTFVGTVEEDFAIEATTSDTFQLGNASWRILKLEPGVVRVADAGLAPPSLPFWFGEAPGRSRELCAEIARLQDRVGESIASGTSVASMLHDESGAQIEACTQVGAWLERAHGELGALPGRARVVVERFFDATGGLQLVLHAPLGSRVNRALGLLLRKRLCRGFGFELQAAADDDAILVSLSTSHGFDARDTFAFLRSRGAHDALVQALLGAPMFATRWRWNAARALLLPRMSAGRQVAPQIQRMRADDLLQTAFPQILACGETLPPGDLPVPLEHPLVAQTLDDCLHEALDEERALAVLAALEDGSLATLAIDTAQPSSLAGGVLHARPYAFLDDAPLEERRAQAVRTRTRQDERAHDALARVDPEAVERVRREAWPDPRDAEEVHEALLWMGFVADDEARPWRAWLDALASEGRVERHGARWFALEAPKEGLEVVRGRLEALGPLFADEPFALEHAGELGLLEAEGFALRTLVDGRDAWCARRLLARIHRYTLDALQRTALAVPLADYVRFLARWQHVDEGARLDGPRGAAAVVEQLAGFHAPCFTLVDDLVARRVRGDAARMLDELGMAGEIAWGRFHGSARAPLAALPITLVPRRDLDTWLALAGPIDVEALPREARAVLDALVLRGPSFASDLARATRLFPSQLEGALVDLVAFGAATCDTLGALRGLRRAKIAARRGRTPPELGFAGRWSALRTHGAPRDASANASHGATIRVTDVASHGAAHGAPDAATSGAPRDERARVTSAHDAPPSIVVNANALRGSSAGPSSSHATHAQQAHAEHLARVLLARWGVVFGRVLAREKLPLPWRELFAALRRLEARGEVFGGRFVAGVSGEQFALESAVEALRRERGTPLASALDVAACDPLNVAGILTPGARTAASARVRVPLAAHGSGP